MRLPIAALLVVAFAAGPASADDKPLVFGIPKPYDAATTSGDARMLEGYLTGALKRPVQGRTFDNYELLATALARGDVDLAWITPLSYVQAGKSAAVVPIAKALRKGLFYRSCVYVRADAKAQKLADLKGTRAAWVDLGSTSGYLFPKGLMLKEGLRPAGFFAAETFAGDHKSACAQVLAGQADVGGTYTDLDAASPRPDGCGEALGADGLTKLRCLAVSDRIPNEVIAGRPGLDDALGADVARIFAALSDTEAGRRVLTSVFRADGFGLALEEDFDPIRLVARSVEAGQWIDKPLEKPHSELLLNQLAPEPAATDRKADRKGKELLRKAAARPAKDARKKGK